MDYAQVSEISDYVGKVNKLISEREWEIYETVNYVFITSTISFFGVVGNVMNIVVFYKQGFNNSMNISFFGLAISDMCSLITLLWFATCVNPLFVRADTSWYPPEISYLTGGVSHICFVRITGCITVFITAERCLCIILPLKIKQLITPRVTTITVTAIYIAIISSFLPEYITSYIGWRFYPQMNKTLLGLVFTSDRKSMEGLVFFMYSVLGLASFVAVIAFTCMLVVKLNEKTKWRQKANADRVHSETIANRDRKSVKMVVLIAVVLIVCYTPGVAASMTGFFDTEFSVAGLRVNYFYIIWSFVFIFEALNSSVNIFLYYRMSSKYRETFLDIFGTSQIPGVTRALIEPTS